MMMKRSLFIMLLCGVLSGCGSAVDTIGVEGIIFPVSKADFVADVTGREGLDYWAPTQSDIDDALPHIKVFLTKHSPAIAAQLQQYRCQYFGIVVEGKKRVYCNFSHRSADHANWRSEPIYVFDGGNMYFQLEYDIEKKQCFNFMVNGEA